MRTPEEHFRTHLTERLYTVVSLLVPRAREEETQEFVRWFADLMTLLVELYTTGWKEPTLEERQEAIRQITADQLLRDALEEIPLED